MPKGSKGGTFIGLIFHHMRAAETCYQKGDGIGAVSHLDSAASLVKAKMPAPPFIETNPFYSPSLQQKFSLYYLRHLGYVARAVRQFVDSHSENAFGVEEDSSDDE